MPRIIAPYSSLVNSVCKPGIRIEAFISRNPEYAAPRPQPQAGAAQIGEQEQAARLLADVSGYLYTDISEQELLGFAIFGLKLSNENIQHITLGPGSGSQDYGDEAKVYDPSVGAEQSAILPQCQNIQPLINHLFGLGSAQSCHVNG